MRKIRHNNFTIKQYHKCYKPKHTRVDFKKYRVIFNIVLIQFQITVP